MVASGRLDGAVSAGKRNDWDLAAGELLVIEAGGAVSGTSGEGYIYNRAQPWQQGLVAAGAKRHAALIDALVGEYELQGAMKMTLRRTMRYRQQKERQ